MRRRPRRARPSAVSGLMRSAATGGGERLAGFAREGDALRVGVGLQAGSAARIRPWSSGACRRGSGWRAPPDRSHRRCAGPCGAGSAEPRQRPGGARGVGDAGAHGQAQIGAIGLHLGEERLLPPEEMRAAGEIDHQPLGRSLRHPGAELPSPAAQRGQERRLPGRVGDAGDEVGAERHGLAQRLAPMEARASRPGCSAR
jgi:hypothetical protein